MMKKKFENEKNVCDRETIKKSQKKRITNRDYKNTQ